MNKTDKQFVRCTVHGLYDKWGVGYVRERADEKLALLLTAYKEDPEKVMHDWDTEPIEACLDFIFDHPDFWKLFDKKRGENGVRD